MTKQEAQEMAQVVLDEIKARPSFGPLIVIREALLTAYEMGKQDAQTEEALNREKFSREWANFQRFARNDYATGTEVHELDAEGKPTGFKFIWSGYKWLKFDAQGKLLW